MLGWALLPGNPYGFFQVLRVVVCGIAAYAAVVGNRSGNSGWTWALGATAALYNPFLPVHLTRNMWGVVNVLTIVLLIAACLFLTRRVTATDNPGKS
jgi:hypothetical protein